MVRRVGATREARGRRRLSRTLARTGGTEDHSAAASCRVDGVDPQQLHERRSHHPSSSRLEEDSLLGGAARAFRFWETHKAGGCTTCAWRL